MRIADYRAFVILLSAVALTSCGESQQVEGAEEAASPELIDSVLQMEAEAATLDSITTELDESAAHLETLLMVLD